MGNMLGGEKVRVSAVAMCVASILFGSCLNVNATEAVDCSGYVERALKKRDKNFRLFTTELDLPTGESTSSLELSHVAHLFDADYAYSMEPVNATKPPLHDISKIYEVAPLGDELLHQQVAMRLNGEEEYRPTNIFELPDIAVSGVKSGSYILSRFSVSTPRGVKSYSIVSVWFRDSGDAMSTRSFLRAMRGVVNLTDAEMAEYGVQFALREGDSCTTLSYAVDHAGNVEHLYTKNFGNLDVSSPQPVVREGSEIVTRDRMHRLYGKSGAAFKYYASSDRKPVGLIGTFEEGKMIVIRDTDFDLNINEFEQVGPNTMPFSKVAKECAKISLKVYDEYIKKGSERFPILNDFIIGCLTNSNFKIVDKWYMPSIRSMLTVASKSEASKTYYVRKTDASGRYDRFSTNALVNDADRCVAGEAKSSQALIECLGRNRYELTDRSTIKPLNLARVATRDEVIELDKSVAGSERVSITTFVKGEVPKGTRSLRIIEDDGLIKLRQVD